MEDVAQFSLAGTEGDFKTKAGNIFGALDSIHYAPSHDSDGFLKSDPIRDISMKSKPYGKMSRGRRVKSLMPPPCGVPRRRQRYSHPGHIKNPQAYTKYSLADVPDDQMTQKSNTLAASQFLRELDARKAVDEDYVQDKPQSNGGKLLFRKPNSQKKLKSDTIKAELECNKQDSARCSKSPKKKKDTVILSHLEYEDEDTI